MSAKPLHNQDGAAQVARLNELLESTAKTLVEQDKRITALQDAMSSFLLLMRKHGDALKGHQAVLEAHGLDAVIQQPAAPSGRLN